MIASPSTEANKISPSAPQVPAQSDTFRHVAQRHGSTIREIEALQFVAGEERQRPTVWRPEERVGPFRARERTGLDARDWSQPDAPHAARHSGDERQLGPVW